MYTLLRLFRSDLMAIEGGGDHAHGDWTVHQASKVDSRVSKQVSQLTCYGKKNSFTFFWLSSEGHF